MSTALDFEAWNHPDPRPIGYRGAHMRVQAARGHASSYRCVGDCGGPAADWAYLHTDPDELVTTVHGKRCSYSLDSDQYAPMCRRCHRRFDHTHRVIATW